MWSNSIRCGPHICFLRYHRCIRGVNFEILQPQCDTDNKSESQTTAAVSLLFYVPILLRPVFMIPHSDFVVSLFSKFLPPTWFRHFDASPWQSGLFVFLNIKSSCFFCLHPKPALGRKKRCTELGLVHTYASIFMCFGLSVTYRGHWNRASRVKVCIHSSVTVYTGNQGFSGGFSLLVGLLFFLCDVCLCNFVMENNSR